MSAVTHCHKFNKANILTLQFSKFLLYFNLSFAPCSPLHTFLHIINQYIQNLPIISVRLILLSQSQLVYTQHFENQIQ